MDVRHLIPFTDTIPANPYFFWIMGIITFTLHILLINIVLGGSIIILYNRLRNSTDSLETSFYGGLPGTIPNIIALGINFGVAPLLFIQVVYGHLFYTSSILLASFKLAIIPLLIIAYYCAYIHKIKYISHHQLSKYALMIMILIMLYIAFIFINNLTIMVKPNTWENYFSNMNGTYLNWSDMTIYPRLLHFITASIAIGGLFTSLIWNYREKSNIYDRDKNIKTGLKIYAYANILQAFIGICYLLVLPGDMKHHFLGGNTIYTVIFFIGVVFAIVSIITAFFNRLLHTVILLLLTIIAMVATRTNVRTLYVTDFFNLSSLKVVPQYDVLVIFIIFLFAGTGLIWYILKNGLRFSKGRLSK